MFQFSKGGATAMALTIQILDVFVWISDGWASGFQIQTSRDPHCNLFPVGCRIKLGQMVAIRFFN